MSGTAYCLISAFVIAVAGQMPVSASAAPLIPPDLGPSGSLPHAWSDRFSKHEGLKLAQAAFEGSSFSVTILSRGSGVPDSAFQALRQVRDLLTTYQSTGAALQVTETRIGLEGERRLCAAFADKSMASAAWERIKPMIENIDLVELKAEPCPS